MPSVTDQIERIAVVGAGYMGNTAYAKLGRLLRELGPAPSGHSMIEGADR